MQAAPYRRISVKSKGIVYHALVDSDGYESLARRSWHLDPSGYVRRSRSQNRHSYLHREIMDLEHGDGLQVDHINRDKLDNRRENLRVVTQAENNRNFPSHRGASSSFRGVCWLVRSNRWEARAMFNGARHFLGAFTDERAAAGAVNAFWTAHGYVAPNDVTGDAGAASPSS